MGYALESVEDHSLMLSCFPLPPLSCRTASLTPHTHCLFLTSVSPPQPLLLSPCPSLTASDFHSLSSCRTSWAHVTSVIKEYLCSALPWKKLLSLLLAVIRLCLDRILGILIIIIIIHRSEVITVPGTLKQTRLCPLSKRASV